MLCQAKLACFLLGFIFDQMKLLTLMFSCEVEAGNDSKKGTYFKYWPLLSQEISSVIN